jgi:Ca-activated chloride channel family protein
MKTRLLVSAGLLCFLVAPRLPAQPPGEAPSFDVTQGALRVLDKKGRVVECPLRHTAVEATISGFVARVEVRQRFVNPWPEPIEAVYVFPLPHGAAVDDMVMVVGGRRIVGVVKRREEARAVYERALAEGRTASLLEQERPNVFTQSVGNIPPGEEVRIEISYVDVLAYDRGAYEFHFPMVVGPRYVPGAPLDRPPTGTGWAPDTTRVKDASRITPPVLRPGERTGHDVELVVRLDAGVKVRDVRVLSHQASLTRPGPSRATAALSRADAIPNKDFVLRYAVAGPRPELALLAHAPRGEDGYFLLMAQPREAEEELQEAPPREICFLVDVSGSMSGAPTAKVVEAMRLLLARLRPRDRLQVVTFASATQSLFPGYVPADPGNVERALRFTGSLAGGGGTEMLRGIRAVLAEPVEGDRLRIVVMLTDGFIGNEAEIIREVARRSGDQVRFWAIGVGQSVNRYLIDGVGRQGGMSAVLGLREDPAPLVATIADRLRRAQLGRIDIDWGGHAVYETYPTRIPDLWAGSPVVVFGRYRSSGPGTIRVSGRAEGRPLSFPLAVDLPRSAGEHAVLARIWARRKIEDLSEQAIVGGSDLSEEITDLALRYRLVSAYTSFVAVDEAEQARLLAAPHPPRRVAVPVPLPEGVEYEGIFGEADALQPAAAGAASSYSRVASAAGAMSATEVQAEDHALWKGKVEGGVPGGVVGGLPLASPTPPPPASPGPDALHMSAEGMRARSNRPSLGAPRPRAGGSWMGQDYGRRHTEARQAFVEARELLSKRDLRGARRALRKAWLLEEGLRWPDQRFRSTLVGAWSQLEKTHAEKATRALPALGKTLDVVVREAGLREAIASLAKAAGVEIRVAAGSLGDVSSSQRRSSLRVAYLDLRGATLAQALGWLLGPFDLEWRVEGGAVVVASSRHWAERSVWAYDAAGLGVTGEEQAHEAEARLREAAGADVVLLDPGRVMVDGDVAAHARAAQALERTSDPVKRRERRRQAEIARALETMREFSWRLLAASLGGERDDEAVAELQEAWRKPSLAAGIEPGALDLASRTAWVVARARSASPDDAALARLAGDAFRVLADALARRAKPPAQAGAGAADVFLALLRSEPTVPASLAALLPAADVVPTGRGPEAVAACLLRRGPVGAVRKALEEGTLRGDDWTLLAAWALRRSGGEAWRSFRAARAELLAGTGISGPALRVVNRLEAAALAVASK